MKFSCYFILVVVAVLVVFCQKSDAAVFNLEERERETIQIINNSSQKNLNDNVFDNATIVLQESYINGTGIITESGKIIATGISAANKLILQYPKAAVKILKKSFKYARLVLYKSGIPVMKSYGIALGLSNEGARQGLSEALKLIQKSGFSSLYGLMDAENFFNNGVMAGGKASQILLNAVNLTVQTGYAESFNNINESIQIADQALRDAKSSPMLTQVENKYCSPMGNETLGLDAIKDIKTAADNSLTRGANPALVEELRKVFNCSVGYILKVTSDCKQTVRTVKATIKEIEPDTAKNIFLEESKFVKREVIDVVANIYIALGYAAFKTGKESNNKIVDESIQDIEEAIGGMFLGVDAIIETVMKGLDYHGDTPISAIEAGNMSGVYAETSFIQGVVSSAKRIFSVL